MGKRAVPIADQAALEKKGSYKHSIRYRCMSCGRQLILKPFSEKTDRKGYLE
jgi:hypothetical protein